MCAYLDRCDELGHAYWFHKFGMELHLCSLRALRAIVQAYGIPADIFSPNASEPSE